MKWYWKAVLVLLLVTMAVMLMGMAPAPDGAWCSFLSLFRFREGCAIVLPIIGGLIYNYVWEVLPGIRDWFNGKTVRQKQLIVAVGAAVLVGIATVLDVYTCGATVMNWLDELARILCMVGVYFGLAHLGHGLDVKYRQKR